MKKQNYNKGRQGEEIAREYLTKRGFEWIESNYKNELGEIDLIMSKDKWLVFVEVKLKLDDRYGNPEEMISRGKIWRIRQVAEGFLVLRPEMGKIYKNYRIDAVCIMLGNNTIERIDHYENIEG